MKMDSGQVQYLMNTPSPISTVAENIKLTRVFKIRGTFPFDQVQIRHNGGLYVRVTSAASPELNVNFKHKLNIVKGVNNGVYT